MKGRIVRSGKRVFTCLIEESKREVEAAAHAVLLKDFHLVVGDLVELSVGKSGEEQFEIVAVTPRVSEVTRYLPRERKTKVIAANCDQQVVMVSVSRPLYKQGLVDRYLVRGQQWGIPSLVVFNKMDQWDELGDLDLCFEKERLDFLGVKYFCVSAVDEGTIWDESLQSLKEVLAQKCSIFSGQSGVGKSKLISKLASGRVELLSGELGAVGKGAHTTTWSEWVDLGAFSVVDSPGIRSFSLEDLIPEDFDHLFSDLQQIFLQCQFSNCQHRPESKGCAIFSDKNNQESRRHKIILSRLESYQRLKDEISRIPWWEKKGH